MIKRIRLSVKKKEKRIRLFLTKKKELDLFINGFLFFTAAAASTQLGRIYLIFLTYLV